jgi:DNA-binding transcriptional MerR regulator
MESKKGSGPSDPHTITQRRRKVSSLRRAGLSVREIAQKLADQEIPEVNPKTGSPWSFKLIASDIKALDTEARQLTIRDTLEHRCEIYAQYQDLLRLAWERLDFDTIAKALKALREMLGTDAPTVIVIEQLQQKMLEGIARLEKEFEHELDICERAINALVGSEPLPTLLN